MMGGKPYGRPMAMVGKDPDGLMLGNLPTALGPFFPGLPSGLEVKLNLQGERIASVGEVINWFPERPASEVGAEPALRAAMGHEVPSTELERLRIRSHLRAMAAILDLAGLEGVARRFLRASGLGDDARASDPTYRGAGFAPVTAPGGDAWARWTVLRDECLQSAAMLSRLGERTTRAAEGPHGPWLVDADGVRGASRANLAVLEQVQPGLLWPEALLTIASLDLDMREAAIR